MTHLSRPVADEAVWVPSTGPPERWIRPSPKSSRRTTRSAWRRHAFVSSLPTTPTTPTAWVAGPRGREDRGEGTRGAGGSVMPRSRRPGRVRGSLLALALLAPVLLGTAPGGSGETISLSGKGPGQRLDVTLTQVVDPAPPPGRSPPGATGSSRPASAWRTPGPPATRTPPRRPRTCWTPPGGDTPATTSPPPPGRPSPRPSTSIRAARRRASSPSGSRRTPTRPRFSSP